MPPCPASKTTVRKRPTPPGEAQPARVMARAQTKAALKTDRIGQK
jgi:hypothetical protein